MDKRLQARRNAVANLIGGGGVAPGTKLPDFQQRIWFLQKMDPFQPMFNISVGCRLAYGLDHERLRDCLCSLVARHDILRAVFPETNGLPHMVIRDVWQITPLVADLSETPDDKQEGDAEILLRNDARQLFDLEYGPLVRCLGIDLGADRCIILLTVHHLVTDGQAMLDLLVQELILTYLGDSLDAAGDDLTFVRFAEETVDAARDIEFWRNIMGPKGAVAELPSRQQRPEVQSYRGGRYTVELPQAEHAANQLLARRCGISPFALHLGAWFALMHACTGATDLVCGCPFTLRRGRRMRRLVGPLIRALPVRVSLDPAAPFPELLRCVSRAVRHAQRHSDVSFGRLLNELDVTRDLARAPLFQTQVAYVRKPMQELKCRDGYVSHFQPDTCTSLYDVSLEVEVNDRSTHLTCIYCSDLYSAEDAQWFAETIRVILRRWAEGDELPIGQQPVSCSAEWAATAPAPLPLAPAATGPLTHSEAAMARIWEDVLGVEGITRADSFFSIGGHSLLIPKILMRVERELGVSLPLHALFEAPTLREFAAVAMSKTMEPADEAGEPAADNPRALSFSQERIWFLHQLDERHRVFNIPAVAPFPFGVEPALLRQAMNEVVRTHESFRYAFGDVDGRPTCQPVDDVRIDIPFEDLRELPLHTARARVRQTAFRLAAEPFDLGRPPLIRMHAMQVRDGETLVVFVAHHLIVDNWSLQIVLHDLLACYRALCWGVASDKQFLSPPALRYADFADRQRRRLTQGRMASMLGFWRDYLDGAPALLQLPTDHPRPPVQTFCGDQVATYAPRETMRQIAEIAEAAGGSSFAALLSVFALLLHRFSCETDLVIGVPVTDRGAKGAHDVVGTFVNMIPIRLRLAGITGFRDLLAHCAEQTLSALQNKDLPFDKLVEGLNPQRHTAYDPIYQVMFDLHIAYDELPTRSATHFDMPQINPGAVQCDIVLNVMESRREDSLITLQYNTDLFDRETATGLLDAYVTLIASVAGAPDVALDRVVLAPGGSGLGNGPYHEFPDACLHDLVCRQARRTPHDIAIVEADRQISFGELDAASDSLARALAGKGHVIGILLPRSAPAICAILAVLKAGAAYVVLDPDLPRDRLSFMIDDAAVETAVSASPWSAIGADLGVKIVDVETEGPSDVDLPSLPATATAAIIYTSGSTGRPRGIRCPHRGFVNRLNWMWREYAFDGDDVCCHKTSLNFVDAVAEIFLPLTRGIKVVVASNETGRVPSKLVDLVHRRRVTRLVVVPSLLRAVLDSVDAPAQLQSLRLLVCSGEPLPPALARRVKQILPECRLLNIYGTTEIAADVTCCEIDEPRGAVVPVGRPIDNVRVRILDAGGHCLPRLFPGEVCVSGICLADGYMSGDDGRFCEDADGERMFKTGDIGRFNNSGELELLGRIDSMLKLRGIRLAPEEVEECLNTIPPIVESAVRVFDQQLIAFCRLQTGCTLRAAGELRSAMRKSLPPFMIPDRFIEVPALPRTASGKLDRAALSRPDPTTPPPPPSAHAANDLEKQLIAIWEEFLGVEPIRRDEDFFELGGHSLIAAEVLAKVDRITGRELPLTAFFQAPTVAEQALLLQSEPAPRQHRALTLIAPPPRERRLYCFHGGFSVMAYHDLAMRLAPEWAVYGLEHPPVETDARTRSLESLVADYLQEIRELQPRGPYYLCGSSAAGVVAFEAAHQLVAAGDEVGLLAMFDTWGPNYPVITSKLQFHLSWNLRRIEHHLGSFLMLSRGRRAKYVAEKRRVGWRQFKVAVYNFMRLIRLPAPDTVPPWAVAFWQAVDKYEFKPYPGRAVLFRASKLLSGIKHDPTHGWMPLINELEVRVIPGFHGAIISEPRCRFLVEQLKELH